MTNEVAPTNNEEETNPVTFEELCSMIESGMDGEKALEWARANGFCVTDEQLDYFERDLEIFDAEAILRGDGVIEDPVAEAQRRIQEEKEAKASKPLTATEKRRAMAGFLMALIVVLWAIRFFFIH